MISFLLMFIFVVLTDVKCSLIPRPLLLQARKAGQYTRKIFIIPPGFSGYLFGFLTLCICQVNVCIALIIMGLFRAHVLRVRAFMRLRLT